MDYGFIHTSTQATLTLSKALSDLNHALESCNVNEKWSFSCNPFSLCTTDIGTGICMNPKNCLVDTRYTDSSPPCPDTQNIINKMTSIFNSINYAD